MQKTGTSVRFLVVEAKEIGRHFAVLTTRERLKTLCARILHPQHGKNATWNHAPLNINGTWETGKTAVGLVEVEPNAEQRCVLEKI